MFSDIFIGTIPQTCICGEKASALRYYKQLNIFMGYCENESIESDITIKPLCQCGNEAKIYLYDKNGKIVAFICEKELLKLNDIIKISVEN